MVLRQIWSLKNISVNTKIRFFLTPTWNRCYCKTQQKGCKYSLTPAFKLPRIQNIWWQDKVSSVDLWKRISQDLAFLGKLATNITQQAPQWNPQGKRKQGHARKTEKKKKCLGRNRRESREVEDICQWPMHPGGATGLSQSRSSYRNR